MTNLVVVVVAAMIQGILAGFLWKQRNWICKILSMVICTTALLTITAGTGMSLTPGTGASDSNFFTFLSGYCIFAFFFSITYDLALNKKRKNQQQL
jgi:hypothetical protein